MAETPARRLVGWKELAEYLGTSPRTVQRWEQEKGLPVRRVPASKGHSVFADSAELDRWLESKPHAAILGAQQQSTGVNEVLIRRHPAIRLAVLAGLALALVAAGTGVARVHATRWYKSAVRALAPSGGRPAITSVSAIQATANQVIIIKGHSLGIHTYYANGDTPFIAIRDQTARWAAGRTIPENWDEVTLNVASWSDSEIVVTGFAGAYGQHWWQLNSGDEIEVAIWNPQTRQGPALYHLTVASGQLARR